MKRPYILVNIVLYHPDEKQLLDLIAVCSEYPRVKILLFDNAEISTALKAHFTTPVLYFQSPKNVGVGGAHYFACEMAVNEGFDFVFFLDQDSCLSINFIEAILIRFSQLKEDHPRLAAVGPSWIDNRRAIKKPKIALNLPAKMLISSGMLIAVPCLVDIGYPKKEYFIDHVDTEWCLRAIHKNYQLVKLNDIQINHALGEIRKFASFTFRYQKPNRYYSCIRNSFFIFSEKWIPLSSRLYILLRNGSDILKIPFVPQPLASCMAVWQAMKEVLWKKKPVT